jgi:hypothetical protein
MKGFSFGASLIYQHPDMITLDRSEIAANKKQVLSVVVAVIIAPNKANPRTQMKSIFESAWLAAGQGKDDTFFPDVIISNPPVQIHVHIAAALQVPLFIMFTMPWSPTNDYPHPLAKLGSGVLYGNKKSYRVVDGIFYLKLRNPPLVFHLPHVCLFLVKKSCCGWV